jgi:hypothetical protein
LTKENLANDLLPAILTILGSIGAAIAVSKRERMLRIENESLKSQVLLWRTLTAVASGVAGWSWYYG